MPPADVIVIVLFAAVLLALLLRVLVPEVIRFVDRAPRRPTRDRGPHFDGAVYARDGRAHRGWDGWYLFVTFAPQGAMGVRPLRALRLSLMTGVYGLDGIDSYDRLGRIPRYRELEKLLVVFGESATYRGHRFLNQDEALRHLGASATHVEVAEPLADGSAVIQGAWPQYRVTMSEPGLRAQVELDVRLDRAVAHWADVPGVFTYASAFGRATGTLDLSGQRSAVDGRCSFEHGCAWQPFRYDWLAAPVLALRRAFSIPVVGYLYNLLFDGGGTLGGVMRATGLGVPVRDLGTLFLRPEPEAEPQVVRLRRIRVVLERPVASSRLPLPASWCVEADGDDGGRLFYRAVPAGPPARVAEHMTYGDFYFDGAYVSGRGRRVPLSGHGYGEYVSIG